MKLRDLFEKVENKCCCDLIVVNKDSEEYYFGAIDSDIYEDYLDYIKDAKVKSISEDYIVVYIEDYSEDLPF